MLVFGIIGIFQKSKNMRGIGYVLAGLGFLFLGIHHMKEGFEAFRDTIDLTAFAVEGYPGILLFTLIGVAATVIMQSSHATLVIIITALASQQITYENALAIAIGANIGTTITAIIGSMSANVQGKRLAAAHLVFNMVTAAIAIAFIFQIAQGVDWISSILGIAQDDYTLKLAVFHSVFNTIGVLVMLPFIQRLADTLESMMTEKLKSKELPIYLNESAEELPDTAIEAVRKETLHLYDNAFAIIAHGLSLHRDDILSDRDLEAIIQESNKVIEIDIDQEYESSVKGLYAEIIRFISRSQVSMEPGQVDELFSLRAAGRDIVEAIKDTKHMHKNMSQFIVSENSYIRDEYNKIRLRLGDLMRNLAIVREEGDDPAMILSLDNLKLEMEENDTTVNGMLESLIRDEKISAQMATSLMNDANYAYQVTKNLIQMGEVLFATSDYDMKLAERDIALSDEELADIINEKPGS
jgi:phosphate:Na+ symporter